MRTNFLIFLAPICSAFIGCNDQKPCEEFCDCFSDGGTECLDDCEKYYDLEEEDCRKAIRKLGECVSDKKCTPSWEYGEVDGAPVWESEYHGCSDRQCAVYCKCRSEHILNLIDYHSCDC